MATPSLPEAPPPESGAPAPPAAGEETKSNREQIPPTEVVENSTSVSGEATRCVAERTLSKAGRESMDSRPDADMMEFVNEVSEALKNEETVSAGDGALHESIDIFSKAIEDDLRDTQKTETPTAPPSAAPEVHDYDTKSKFVGIDEHAVLQGQMTELPKVVEDVMAVSAVPAVEDNDGETQASVSIVNSEEPKSEDHPDSKNENDEKNGGSNDNLDDDAHMVYEQAKEEAAPSSPPGPAPAPVTSEEPEQTLPSTPRIQRTTDSDTTYSDFKSRMQ